MMAVLEVLTSERAVPSQNWPKNIETDRFFIHLITDLLVALGGSSFMSKLRQCLKDQLRLEPSIKSVPLKNFITVSAT